MYGYTSEEIIGVAIERFLAPDARPGVLQGIAEGRDVAGEFVGMR